MIRTLKRARRSQNNLGCNGGKKGLSWKILLSVHLSPIVLVQQILWQNSWPDLPASVKLDMKSQARISELMLIIQKKSSPFLSSRAFLFFVHKHYESAHFACTLGICVLAFQLHRLHFYTVWPIVATTKNGRCRGGCSVHTGSYIMVLGLRRLMCDTNPLGICSTEHLNMTSVHSPGSPSSRKLRCYSMFFIV